MFGKSTALTLVLALVLSMVGIVGLAEAGKPDVLANPAANEVALWVKGSADIEDMGDGNYYWRDYSGKGNHMRVFGVPQYISSGLNGHGVMKFTKSSGQRLDAKFAQAYQGSSTIFIVARVDSSSGDYKCVYTTQTFQDSHTGQEPHTFDAYTMVINNNIEGCTWKSGTTDRQHVDAVYRNYTWGSFENRASRITATGVGDAWTNTQFEAFKDGVRKDNWDNRADINAQFNKYTGFCLGAMDWGTPDMQVAECIVVFKALSDTEIKDVSDYLNRKYFGDGYDPFPSNAPPADTGIIPDGGRLALWVDGSTLNTESHKWIDKSKMGNDLDLVGDVSVENNALNGKSVVLFKNRGYATKQLSSPYTGSTNMFMVIRQKPKEEQDGGNFNYKGYFATHPLIGGSSAGYRDNSIMLEYTGDGVEFRLRSGDSDNMFKSLIWNSSYPGLYNYGMVNLEIIDNSSTGADSVFNFYQSSLNSGQFVSNGTFPTTNTNKLANKHFGYTIPARWDQSAAIACEIAEVIVYQGKLSPSETAKVRSYLAKKYFAATTSNVTLSYQTADGMPSSNAVAGGKVKIDGTLINNSFMDSVSNAKLIAAVYNNGKLYKVVSKPIDFIAVSSGTTPGTYNFTFDYMDLPQSLSNTKVRFFVFSDLGNIVPLGCSTERAIQ